MWRKDLWLVYVSGYEPTQRLFLWVQSKNKALVPKMYPKVRKHNALHYTADSITLFKILFKVKRVCKEVLCVIEEGVCSASLEAMA